MRRKFPVLRKVLLFIGDMLVVLISVQAATVLIIDYYRGTSVNVAVHFEMLPLMMAVVAMLLNINELFSLTRKRYCEIFIGLAMTMFNLLIVMMAVSFFLREFSYSRSILFLSTGIQFLLLAILNYMFWRVEHAQMLPRNVLVMGSETECERVIARLRSHTYLKDYAKYICTDYDNENWQRVSDDIDLVIVCSDFKLQNKAELIHFCHVYGKQVFIIPEFYDLFCSSVDLDKIDDIPVFRPRYLKPTLEQRFLKRLLDIGVSVISLLLLWPLSLILAIAIKLDSPGTVFYSQIRSGQGGKEFKVYKFRTMRQDAEKLTGPVLAADNDPRITKVGRFLRATRLDELPQLVNVLLGDMSMVGPRPERPYFVSQFINDIPEYIYRQNVKPGITGLAQIYGKYNSTPYDKLVYDLIYIQKFNVIYDLVIMMQTLQVLLSKESTEGVRFGMETLDLARYEIR